MEVLDIQFESWNVFHLRFNWFAILLLFLIILVVYWISDIVSRRVIKKSIMIDEINLGIGNSSVKLIYDKKDREIAYKLWVELSTRKIGIPFDKEYDVIIEVYNSWYEFFRIARELLKAVPVSRLAYSSDLIDLTERVLNNGLRPHLTIWQAKYRKWYERECSGNIQETPQEIQRKYPQYDELVKDLIETNIRMMEYKSLMKEIAFQNK